MGQAASGIASIKQHRSQRDESAAPTRLANQHATRLSHRRFRARAHDVQVAIDVATAGNRVPMCTDRAMILATGTRAV